MVELSKQLSPYKRRNSGSESDTLSLTTEELLFARKVRLLSYNFYLRPAGVKGPHSEFKDVRLQLFIDREMDNFDILCFQEVFATCSDRRDYFIKEARKAGFDYSCHCESPGLLSKCSVDGGLLILSRYPILESEFRPFEAPAILSDCLSLKGVLYARIDLSKAGH